MSSKYSLRGLLISVTAVAFVTGCAGPQPSSQEDINEALSLQTSTGVEEYVLGPTDEIQISVWRNADLSIGVPVRPDGRVSMPLIGDVQATGKTPEQLANEIEEGLKSYIREPQVTVVVKSMGSQEFNNRVRVTGAVNQPISVPHRSGMTVLDMVLSAGGANPFANLNDAMLYRSLGNRMVAIPVRLNDILSKGDVSTNYRLRPGDILTVPERNF
ncbi:XrtA/PEP-CTERM system exopolysaccharide export protein [Marinobacter sp. UBA2498]|jgi:polysaccharide export outer membrane protein|uniref:XrtA/PEP-CTERM system exopolysaccharide export protein n=1 Tax=Marinobacter sp. UBA2498 TaxID=1946813 RepID=UPI000C5FE59C|nr:XrtA/PEP-CTERM system exopolysaccharide export protein [Marinobacter sp. UBA2498]MAO25949.1 sugar ABC transporter substrate-binding protein [Roseovarius sp.]|tara:strand:+ start:1515 stop:2159 length:645 start_codon:yes stop_codon:yes gene_type:complete